MRTYTEMYGQDADGRRGTKVTYLDISTEEVTELVKEEVAETGHVPRTLLVECDGYEFEIDTLEYLPGKSEIRR